MLMAFKQAEEGDGQHWILRYHEAQGEQTPITVDTALPLTATGKADGLEEWMGSVPTQVAPWEIQNLRFTVTPRSTS
jgi:alpha-mannosidase